MAELRKDFRKMVRAAEDAGYVFVRASKNGHPKLRRGAHTIPIPKSPSDWRAVKNFRAQLRREGIKVP